MHNRQRLLPEDGPACWQVTPEHQRRLGEEISLDLELVLGTCPDCHIPLVEARSSSCANLGAAVNKAAKITGVTAISNGCGGGDATDTTYGSYLRPPGHRRDRVHR